MDADGLMESWTPSKLIRGRRPPFPQALGKPANDRRLPTAPTGPASGPQSRFGACFDQTDGLELHVTRRTRGGMFLKRPGPILLMRVPEILTIPIPEILATPT
jgi:hypothetical protein